MPSHSPITPVLRRAVFLGIAAGITGPGLAFTAAAHAADGPVATVAGTTAGFAGDGGPAIQARITGPRAAALAPDGRLLIADSVNLRVRLVSPTGTISTIAQVVATLPVRSPAAQLSGTPSGVAFDAAGTPLVADETGAFIGRITPAPNPNAVPTVAVIAGMRGATGFGGDGGPATAAKLDHPAGLAVGPDGSIYIADAGNDRIRKVSPAGVITTVAGSSAAGFSGDGGPATQAALNDPTGVAVDAAGGLLIADTANNRIRRVAPDGTITSVAGGGQAGFSGDGLPASAAALSRPTAVTPLRLGGFVVADTGNNRVRRVTPLGTIFTIAGGAAGLTGDAGPASAAQFSAPQSIVTTPSGGFLVADTGNSRIRTLASDGVLPGPIPGRTLMIARASGFVQATVAGQAGPKALREPDLVVLGTRANAEKGVVTVQTATTDGGMRTATVSLGQFSIDQPAGAAQTDLRLTAPLNGCRTTEGGTAARAVAAAARKTKTKRRRRSRKIFVHAEGGHRSVGRYADAVVRGTQWTIQDFCTSTRVTVREGIVAVTDREKHRVVLVHAGNRYIARLPKRR